MCVCERDDNRKSRSVHRPARTHRRGDQERGSEEGKCAGQWLRGGAVETLAGLLPPLTSAMWPYGLSVVEEAFRS